MKFLFWLATAVVYSNWIGHANGAPLELSIRYERDVRDVPVPAPIVLTWEAVPGRSYNVLAAEAPNSGAWTTLNSAPLIAETNRQVYRDLNSGGSRFYQVVALNPAVAVTHVAFHRKLQNTHLRCLGLLLEIHVLKQLLVLRVGFFHRQLQHFRSHCLCFRLVVVA